MIAWIRADIGGYLKKRQRMSVTDGKAAWGTTAVVPLLEAAADFIKSYQVAGNTTLRFESGYERLVIELDASGSITRATTFKEVIGS